MNRVLSLILVLSLVVIARHIGGDGGGRFATMALGFILIVAALVGQAFEQLRLPMLTGYLLVGLCSGPSVLNLVTPAMTGQLRLVNGLAVALIAFGAGMELDLHDVRRHGRSLLVHGGVLLAVLYLGLFLAALAVTPWLPFATSWPTRVAIALMVAATMATFSPTVVMAVLSETRASGPFSARILQLVVVADLAVVVLFTGATTVAHVLDGASVDIGAVVHHVGWEIFGSIAAGLLLGVGVALYRRFIDRRTGLLLLGASLFMAELGPGVGLSPLLACLAAGFLARNVAPAAASEMAELLEHVRLPVLVVFFAAAGASLHLHQVLTVAPMAVGLVLVRAALIAGANRIAARKAGLPPAVARFIPAGLVSQAGIALGLAVIVGRDFGQWGGLLETLFVATISLHELGGPILFRWSLQRVGEIPADARPHAAHAEAGSVA